MNSTSRVAIAPDYELRYQSRLDAARCCTFPCDAAGRVDMDALSDRARDNYLYARAVVGREYLMPAITLRQAH